MQLKVIPAVRLEIARRIRTVEDQQEQRFLHHLLRLE